MAGHGRHVVVERKRFKRLPKIAQPNKTFYTTGKLESGIQYGYIPDAAHTDGDLYVYFPKQNVLAVGDVVSGAGLARRRLADRRMDWRDRRRPSAVADDRERRHEDCSRVAGRCSSWQTSRNRPRCTATIYDRLSTMLNKGRGPTEAVEAKPTKEFDAQMGNGDEFVRRSFESLWAYLSPDA